MNAFLSRSGRVAAALLLAVGTLVVVVDHADARRAGSFGSFGSRGGRTFQAPAPTQIAPNTGAPIQRTMTPRPAQQPGAAAQPGGAAATQRPGGLFGGGFMGPLLGGLALGGLFGMLMGNGFGGAAGFLGMILQIALIGIVIMLVMRFFRSRQQGASAAAAGPAPMQNVRPDLSGVDVAPARAGRGAVPSAGGLGGVAGGLFGGGDRAASAPAAGWTGDAQTAVRPASERLGDGRWTGDEIGVTAEDLDDFERILTEVQAAYTREDFGKLRALTTPEAMGYLAEELGETATKGQKNEVSDIRLLDGDVAEAWSEDGKDYVTAALRYESRDVLRDRETNAVVEGGDDPSEATELWTFVRDRGAGWKLAAIQAAA